MFCRMGKLVAHAVGCDISFARNHKAKGHFTMKDISLKFKNYKCFGDDFQGFDSISPINIIIGRNNSGKSSLLDLVKYAVAPYDLKPFAHKDKMPQVVFQKILLESEAKNIVDSVFSRQRTLANVVLQKLFKDLVAAKMTISINFPNGKTFYNLKNTDVEMNIESEVKQSNLKIKSPFEDKIFKSLKSERDISTETEDTSYPPGESEIVSPDGSGATRIIQHFINDSSLPTDLVRVTLLQALNEIMRPDSYFTDIIVQKDSLRNPARREWEIYIKEDQKGHIALSDSGSGLKTVLLVLIFIHLIPKFENKPLSHYIFAFEELENNLHPALQRRLFSYIKNIASEKKAYFFITTHSNVVIDLFSGDPEAQLIHITHDGESATVNPVTTFMKKHSVLSDLGARASDLLQSNGIVWLEGPSDRIYFNKWIELYSIGELMEHRDYECAFYGGSVLKHFEATEPEKQSDAINILRVNRNAILVGDSDKTAGDKPLKQRLEKIKKEMEEIGAYVWVTDAKEIENYIPAVALEKTFDKTNLPDIEQYQRFYYDSDKAKVCGYWQKNKLKGTFDKVGLARDVIIHLTKENLKSRFDLEKQMQKICDTIKTWNEDIK